MTTAYAPDPTQPHLVPLGTDPATGAPVLLDWEMTPHLTIAAYAGQGTTSLIRLIAAHTVATGGTATVIDGWTAEYEEFTDIPGLDVAYEPGEVRDVIRSYVADMEDRLRTTSKGPVLVADRRVLAVDGLAALWHNAKQEEDQELLWALTDLKRILWTGRAAGVHLVTDIEAAIVMQQLDADLLRSATATLMIGPADHDLARLLGVDPLLERPGDGAAIWRTPANQGRELDLTYITAEQARTLALGTVHH
ncbi:hypothetical protein OS965_29965 [Streptomyces sp. H27-G5]|uniref:hypothetical protein n=1 Tax=Streptomyces sp. H27-G5 TaxID=2996698 RepID=UPI00227173DD|nr:hypothetical protein [Streptomyces sp. H27-G5]MCY0922337.1 hypothetical protein [Streptomyces sp. H27-G5]